MRYTTFKHLYKDVSSLDGLHKHREALALLERALDSLPVQQYEEHWMEIKFTEATLCYQCGMYEQYLQIISGLIEEGYAYPQKYLNLMSVEGECFAALKVKNVALLAQAQHVARLQYQVDLPDGYTEEKQYPLFLALHGNGGNLQEFRECWAPEPLLEKGLICVYVQSSQVWCYGSYGWTQNLAVAKRDLWDCYQQVAAKYRIDPARVLMGGFSGGGIASIDAVMVNQIPVCGLIALSPGAKPESCTLEAVEAAAYRGVKVLLMEGEILVPVPAQEEMLSLFRETGLAHRFQLNEGIGHWFPDDFAEKLADAVDFLLTP